MPLIDPVERCYHLWTKSTYSEILLRRQNAINTLRPVLADPDNGDARMVAEEGIMQFRSQPIPDFTWDDAPRHPHVPVGERNNAVPYDYARLPRSAGGTPGAWAD